MAEDNTPVNTDVKGGTREIGMKLERLPYISSTYSPSEKPLDYMIQMGLAPPNPPVQYKTTFFEDHLENTLRSTKFGNSSLGLPKKYSSNLVRQSKPDISGITCKYIRKSIDDIFKNSEMNDHRKITESVEFFKGTFRTILKKGEYAVSFFYGKDDTNAIGASIDAYTGFKKMVEGIGRKVNDLPKFETRDGLIIIAFDTKRESFDPMYEFFFQYEILHNFLTRIGKLKV